MAKPKKGGKRKKRKTSTTQVVPRIPADQRNVNMRNRVHRRKRVFDIKHKGRQFDPDRGGFFLWFTIQNMFWKKKPKRKPPRMTKQRRHYLEHKEQARILIQNKINHWNGFYNFPVGQVRIKNVKTRWGSCSSKKNLNFNYKILFLPEHLQDYIVVHELCHLEELNHSAAFWKLVEQQIPDYRDHVKELRAMHIPIH